jgi:hypothetical protein
MADRALAREFEGKIDTTAGAGVDGLVANVLVRFDLEHFEPNSFLIAFLGGKFFGIKNPVSVLVVFGQSGRVGRGRSLSDSGCCSAREEKP